MPKPADAGYFLVILGSFPIETMAKAWADTLYPARAHNLSAHLELALRLGLPLAMLNDKLMATTEAADVFVAR